ncbi:MAG: T9SS type A sorting domain-containing protein, partial [Bacteroidetes bacterium]|nr:T9SS type A sorting domain-containing protein [Bacteroidota bacterium]
TDKATSDLLVNELIGWYTLEKFPSDTSNTYATAHTFTNNNHDMELPQGICGSPLCHVSVTHWCEVADKAVGSNERKERCARLTGDIAAKAVELLNAHFDGSFVSYYVAPDSVGDCLACHGGAGMVANVAMKQTCIPCHGAEPHSSSFGDPGALNHTFKVKQNFPNPFNSNTTIEFTLPKPENVTIEVYNLNGQHIKTLASNKHYTAGDYSLQWNGNDEHGQSVESGMYFSELELVRA